MLFGNKICPVNSPIFDFKLNVRQTTLWRHKYLRFSSPTPVDNTPTQTSPLTPYTWAEKFESLERINSIRETNGKFCPCKSCKRLVPSRLHELYQSKFPFVSRIEFIRLKLSNFCAHVYGVNICPPLPVLPITPLLVQVCVKVNGGPRKVEYYTRTTPTNQNGPAPHRPIRTAVTSADLG